VPRRSFDVIWGQGAWMHIADTAALLERAAGAIVPGGRLVFEEGYRKRSPRDDAEAGLLTELERLWGGHFLSRETFDHALTLARSGVLGYARFAARH
jgi:hypothetical protein